jgi:hypothetical protein
MPRKAITQTSDSLNQAVMIEPPKQRKYTLTVTGWQAGKLLNASKPDDEFAYFCPGCLRVLASCSCPIDER